MCCAGTCALKVCPPGLGRRLRLLSEDLSPLGPRARHQWIQAERVVGGRFTRTPADSAVTAMVETLCPGHVHRAPMVRRAHGPSRRPCHTVMSRPTRCTAWQAHGSQFFDDRPASAVLHAPLRQPGVEVLATRGGPSGIGLHGVRLCSTLEHRHRQPGLAPGRVTTQGGKEVAERLLVVLGGLSRPGAGA